MAGGEGERQQRNGEESAGSECGWKEVEKKARVDRGGKTGRHWAGGRGEGLAEGREVGDGGAEIETRGPGDTLGQMPSQRGRGREEGCGGCDNKRVHCPIRGDR